MPELYQLHSTVSIRRDELETLLETIDLPEDIESLELKRRENTLIVEPSTTRDDIGQYTPLAKIKATCQEKRLYENEDGELTNHSPGSTAELLQWEDMAEGSGEDEGPQQESATFEFAMFKGHGDDVLFNSALNTQMFEVLKKIALSSDQGSLTAILGTDDELTPVSIIDGEEQPAGLHVREHREDTDDEEVDWEDNKYIKS